MTGSEKGLQDNDLSNSEEITGERTILLSKQSLLCRLRRSKEARARLVSSYIDKGIAYQIRAIRDHQELSQEELAEMVGMNQNAISRLESPWYGKATIRTLKRLAAAFDVALVIRFVPFSKLTSWISGTPYLEEGISAESLAVPNFEEEEQLTEAAKSIAATDFRVSGQVYTNALTGMQVFSGNSAGENDLGLDNEPPIFPKHIARIMWNVSLDAAANLSPYYHVVPTPPTLMDKVNKGQNEVPRLLASVVQQAHENRTTN